MAYFLDTEANVSDKHFHSDNDINSDSNDYENISEFIISNSDTPIPATGSSAEETPKQLPRRERREKLELERKKKFVKLRRDCNKRRLQFAESSPDESKSQPAVVVPRLRKRDRRTAKTAARSPPLRSSMSTETASASSPRWCSSASTRDSSSSTPISTSAPTTCLSDSDSDVVSLKRKRPRRLLSDSDDDDNEGSSDCIAKRTRSYDEC